MKLSAPTLLACLLLLPPSLVQAGVYLKAAGLYHQTGDIELKSASAFGASLKSNVGFAGALGYKFSLVRIEAELQHMKSDADADANSGTLAGGVTSTVGGVKKTSGFANGYFDLPSFFGLAPYLGAGLGYARVDLENLGRIRNNTPVAQYSGRDSVFGYQGMFGLQFHVLGRATINAGFRIIRREDVAVRDVITQARETISFGSNRVFELGLALGF